jgi:hypothetical protein
MNVGIIAAARRRGAVYPALETYGTDEAVTEQSTTGTALTGGEILGTPAANTDYLLFWSQDVQSSSTGASCFSDLKINGSTVFANRPKILPRETGSPIDYHSMGGFVRYQSGPSPSGTSFTLTGERDNSATIKLRNSRLSYLELGPDDEYAQSTTRQTFSSAINKTAQTAATLTVPAGAYTVFASFNIDMVDTSNVQYEMELTNGVETTGVVFARPNTTNDRCPVMLFLPSTSGGTVSLKVRQSGSGSTTIGISDIRIVALENGRFADVDYIVQGADSGSTAGSYTTTVSQTISPAGDHLSIALWQQGSTSTSVSVYGRYLDGADTVGEFIREFRIAVADSGLGGVAHRIADYDGSSRTQAIQRRSEASSNNQIQKSAAIVTIKLEGL